MKRSQNRTFITLNTFVRGDIIAKTGSKVIVKGRVIAGYCDDFPLPNCTIEIPDGLEITNGAEIYICGDLMATGNIMVCDINTQITSWAL
jgi:hypothetical protein